MKEILEALGILITILGMLLTVGCLALIPVHPPQTLLFLPVAVFVLAGVLKLAKFLIVR
jgi:hypothetical protein